MAVARVEVCWSSTDEERQAIGRSVQAALVEALGVPADDPTVIVIDRAHDTLVAPSKVSDRYTTVSITLFLGRTFASKERLYASIVDHLGVCGIPARDVLTVLHEVPIENWGVDGGVPASKTDVGFRIDV